MTVKAKTAEALAKKHKAKAHVAKKKKDAVNEQAEA